MATVQVQRTSAVRLPTRLPLLAGALLALLVGLWAGLLRVGWNWPLLLPTLPLSHGPLMINGFLGTLIGLERAVALGKRWAYLAPLSAATGTLLLVLGAGGTGGTLGYFMLLLSGLLLIIVMVAILRLHPTLDTAVIMGGVFLWLAGNLLWWWGVAVGQLVFWWAGFLILTIAGERLELSRLLRLPTSAIQLFLAVVLLYVGGLIITFFAPQAGARLIGGALVALALWLLRYDIARRRIKAGGQARFTALCLLSGYGWLAIAGLLAIRYPGQLAGPYYDALLHAIFLGFVFTMIFGHAPIVFPAVLQRPLPYRPHFYSHLLLLHITLAVRIAGDLLLSMSLRQWGALLNALVLLLFLGNTVVALVAGAKGERSYREREMAG
ncbi:MAG TPA: hypothetical protein P5121_06415 [Caldilineaceae bacterium]|nr:hypothetical protein [Caldilineaceae bacterium]